MRPRDIRYIQCDVSHQMEGRDLLEVFKDLVRGELTVDDMEPIEVVTHRGLTFAYDGNRRLTIYKVGVNLCICSSVPQCSKTGHTMGVGHRRPQKCFQSGGGGGVGFKPAHILKRRQCFGAPKA